MSDIFFVRDLKFGWAHLGLREIENFVFLRTLNVGYNIILFDLHSFWNASEFYF
jgi:hypothetical protein